MNNDYKKKNNIEHKIKKYGLFVLSFVLLIWFFNNSDMLEKPTGILKKFGSYFIENLFVLILLLFIIWLGWKFLFWSIHKIKQYIDEKNKKKENLKKEDSLITDKEISKLSDDEINMKPHVNTLKRIVTSTEGPFTVAVNAKWGLGKTSFLRMVETEIKKNKEIIPVWFNPWEYEDEKNILPFLFYRISSAIRERGGLEWKELGESMEVIGKSINNLEISFAGIGVKVGDLFLSKKRKYTKVQEAFDKFNIPKDKKIVIFIDDLDRLEPKKSYEILSSLKKLFNKKGVVFVLAISKEEIDKYIEKKYKDEYGDINKIKHDPKKYMDKIIQFSFDLPMYEENIEKYVEGLLNKESFEWIKDREEESVENKTENKNRKEITKILIKVTDGNLREIKQLLNYLIFTSIVFDEKIKEEEKKDKESFLLNVFLWEIFKRYDKSFYFKMSDYDFAENNKKIGENNESNKKYKEILLRKPESNLLKNKKLYNEWMSNNIERREALEFFKSKKELSKQKEEIARELIKKYTKKIKNEPENPKWYCERGDVYDSLKQYKKAIRDFDEAVKKDEEYKRAYFYRGISYDNLKKYQKAIDDFTKAIEIDPKNANFYYIRGISYDNLKKYQKAIDDFTKAIELDPKDADFYISRGILYDNLKKYQKAIDDFTKAIELDLKNTSAYVNLGWVYYKMKEYQKAIEEYRKAIELDPEDANIYCNLGLAFKLLGKIQESKRNFDKSLSLYNKKIEEDLRDVRVYIGRGEVLKELKRFEDALDDYNKALMLDSENGEAYNGRAEVFDKLGKHAEAEKDFKKAKELGYSG